MTSMRSEWKTSSKAAVNLLSRSRIRKRTGLSRSSRVIIRFRACWVTQAPSGLRCRLDAVAPKDGPYRARRDRNAEASKFALDPSVAPGRVLPGQPNDELAQLSRDSGTTGAALPVRPPPAYELAVRAGGWRA